MLSLRALSNSLIRSAVSRMASWEAERGSWGSKGVQRKGTRRRRRRVGSKSSKKPGRKCFSLSMFCFKYGDKIFLHWGKAILTKDNLTESVFVSPFAEGNLVHVKQKIKEIL